MAKQTRKFKKGAFPRIIVGIVFGIVLTYIFTAALKILIEAENIREMTNNILSFRETINFAMNTEQNYQLVIFISSLVFTGFTLTKMRLYEDKYEDASSFGVHGTSRWGKPHELIDSGIISKKNHFYKKNPEKTIDKIDSGIILGKIPNENRLIILPTYSKIDNRNVLIVGASGSGKGQSFVINNIVNNCNESLIVTDPKGELARLTKQIKIDQGYEVFEIDFLNMEGAGYNPLDYIKEDVDAIKIAKAISKNSAKDGKEDFFFTTARDLLIGIILYVKHENPKANIPVDVKNMFFKISRNPDYLTELTNQLPPDHPSYQYLTDASIAEGKTRTSILSSFSQQVAIFNTTGVQRLTSKSDFNFSEFQKKKSILYVKIPMKNNPVEALTATFFDQLISVLYDYADHNEGVLDIPTILMLDEFANLGKIHDYEGTLSTCRGLGMSCVTVVQDFAQLENTYSKEISRTIINNHDTTLYLRTKDPETATFFEKLAGKTTVKIATHSKSTQGGIFSSKYSGSQSESEQYVSRPLITEGEFSSIKKDDAYLFIAGHYPLKLNKAWQSLIFGDYIDHYEKYKKSLLNEIKLKKTKIQKAELKSIEKEIEKEQKPTGITPTLDDHNKKTEVPLVQDNDIDTTEKESNSIDEETNAFNVDFHDEDGIGEQADNVVDDVVNSYLEKNKTFKAQKEFLEQVKMNVAIMQNVTFKENQKDVEEQILDDVNTF